MNITQNYNMIIIPVLTLILTRILKVTIYYFRHNQSWKESFKHAMTYGHMPSVHTALMVSLVTSVGYYTGVYSGAFAVASVLAIIIIDDATRLRVYMGNLGRYINAIRKNNNIELDKKYYPRLKERMGHRTSEVLAGALVGFVFTILLITILS